MSPTELQILVILLIFIGESFSIYAEIIGARTAYISSQPVLQIFLKMFLIITIAGGFLIAGYIFGFQIFKNIWIVSVVSITSILIMEPILAYVIFQQLPTRGALIGLVLGAAGFIAAIFL